MIEALYQTVLQHTLYGILLPVFLVLMLVQLVYYWVFFRRLAFYSPPASSQQKPPVSVIVLVHNQYNDLQKNLPELLQQDYPDFEVVVVDDNSDDGSKELLERYAEKFANLRILQLTQSLNWFKGRKFPLSLGIKSASHDILLLCDITFRPSGRNRISEMVKAYDYKTEIVLGYATYNTQSKINKWLRFTTFYDGLLYLSMAISGFGFKGIGKNLSYRKSLFYRHKGFSSHYVINAGDDELFVNKAATRNNISVKISQDSIVKSTKPLSFFNWLQHEKTRLSIRRFFKFKHRMLISLFSTSTFLFYVVFAWLLLLQIQWPVVIAIFLFRLINQLVIFGLIQKKLSEKKLLLFTPVFELIISLIDFFIWFKLLFTKKTNWS